MAASCTVVEAGEDVEEVGECQGSGGSLSLPGAGGCSAQLLHHVDAAGAGGGGEGSCRLLQGDGKARQWVR